MVISIRSCGRDADGNGGQTTSKRRDEDCDYLCEVLGEHAHLHDTRHFSLAARPAIEMLHGHEHAGVVVAGEDGGFMAADIGRMRPYGWNCAEKCSGE